VSWYSIASFLHIVGALGLFAGISLEQAGLRRLGRASTTAALREWLTVMRARRRVERPAGPIPPALRQRIVSPLLRAGAALRATLALGIVFNMAVKPDAPVAVLTLVAALILGGLAPWIPGHSTLATREYGAEH
jgi:hypothetical protein